MVAYLDKTLGFGQEAQRGVSRGFWAQRNQYLQLFEAISEVSSPATAKAIGTSVILCQE